MASYRYIEDGAVVIGDGKIFVINLDHAVRIRTGEADAAAL